MRDPELCAGRPQITNSTDKIVFSYADAIERTANSSEGGLLLVLWGGLIAAIGSTVLPATTVRAGEAELHGQTLLEAGPGYWVLVGVAIVALLTGEWWLRRNRAALALAALGGAALLAAPLLAWRLTATTLLPSRPASGLLALAAGGAAVAAGGVLLRRASAGRPA